MKKIVMSDLMMRNGRRYRFVKDHLGSIRYVVDVQTGDIVQELVK